MLRRVAGRPEGAQHDGPDAHLIAVVERLVGKLLLAETAGQDGSAGGGGELARAGDEVGVDVGLEDGGDARTVPVGPGKVGVDVATRVDDGDLAGGLVGDPVGDLREAGREDAVDDHGDLLL